MVSKRIGKRLWYKKSLQRGKIKRRNGQLYGMLHGVLCRKEQMLEEKSSFIACYISAFQTVMCL